MLLLILELYRSEYITYLGHTNPFLMLAEQRLTLFKRQVPDPTQSNLKNFPDGRSATHPFNITEIPL